MLSLNEFLEHDLAPTQMNSRTVTGHVDIHLEGLLLQEHHVEVIYFVLEAELCGIGCPRTFSHLRGLCPVIVEVHGHKSDQVAF